MANKKKVFCFANGKNISFISVQSTIKIYERICLLFLLLLLHLPFLSS